MKSKSHTYDSKNILHSGNEDHQQVDNNQEDEGNNDMTTQIELCFLSQFK